MEVKIVEKAADTIRVLAAAMVEKAKSDPIAGASPKAEADDPNIRLGSGPANVRFAPKSGHSLRFSL